MRRQIIYLCSAVFVCGAICLYFSNYQPQKVAAADVKDEIEKAMFTRQKFFGAEAIVPLPTSEARENLARLAENLPNETTVLAKLADANEKLQRFDEAEKNLIRAGEIDPAKLETLVRFYERRGEFEKKAAVLNKILFSTEPKNRAAVFERLLETARIHELNDYLNQDFYHKVAAENPNLYSIFEKLIDNLKEEKNYDEALNFARQARTQFPARKDILLGKEIAILTETNRNKEAVKVYEAAFDPFWAEDEAQKYYDFLSEQDQLRVYGSEIKARFDKNNADFDSAVRLGLYRNHDYSYGNDSIEPIIAKLEAAKKSWTTGELVTAARLLLKENETATASRFLYTLYAREDFQKNSALRAQILYQIFEMFCQADNQKLPISKGDLRFYEDVAKTDTDPGIATGILSLVFSDTNPSAELDSQEIRATEFFNRAAAVKIFEEYKKENPKSPELAQMYLDIVRIYANEKEPEIALKTLDEFAANYDNSKDYTDAALKLADAFEIVKRPEKTREIYQKVLDYLGKNRHGALKIEAAETDATENETTGDETGGQANLSSNGMGSGGSTSNDEYSDHASAKIVFDDYLGTAKSKNTYADVLTKLVASLSGEKKTAEILQLYSNEIAKYPEQQWLYEERLRWLEQTNLVDEQFATYKEAINRFKTNDWNDKLARFFVRQNRDAEFAEFSNEMIGKLNDEETGQYLSEFIDGKVSSTDFNRQLYFKLYQAAHQRFPHNITFVSGLLRYYAAWKNEAEWRKLAAEYYFESADIRGQFSDKLAANGNLRDYLAQSANGENVVYELFRADASERLSNFENAVAAYRNLNKLYPNNADFPVKLINLTRSFGQNNREMLTEAANISRQNADFQPSSSAARTTSGEIFAELGDYSQAHREWEKLIQTASGDKEIYLDTAAVYWDYYQYDDALQTIHTLRGKFDDDSVYAFEAGAVLESQHKEKEAVGEYVKALGIRDDDDLERDKAIKRLKFLTAKNDTDADGKPQPNNSLQTIDAAYRSTQSRTAKSDYIALGYAKFLTKIKQTERAETILSDAVSRSSDAEFVEKARDFYEREEIGSGERASLKRLSEISDSPRRKIQYALQTAESFEENKNPPEAKIVLAKLVREFPNNYGVLTETSDFYKRLGDGGESVRILQNALPRSRGTYRKQLSSKLSARLLDLDRASDAERILTALHRENPSDTDVFRELAKVCVRTGNADLMRQSFAETVAEMKKSDDRDRRELDSQIADLRKEMIDVFTKFKDYKSAVEQHIEIINRDPEDEETTDNAVAYVERYGGADVLLAYYLKLSAEAFKNYRWNVVLARIYESRKDAGNAVKNYQAAIANQPEMPELYLAIADIETKRNNFDAALQNIDEVLTLTNNAPENIKKKIEILKKAGRTEEIAAANAKLPAEPEIKIETDKFAEARNLAYTEKEKARQIYREAFANLLADPLNGEFKTYDISAYIQSAREEEPLDKIAGNLWNLRGKLIEIADETNGKNAGEAKSRLSMLDAAMTETVGNILKTVATDEEIANLHEDLQRRIGEKSFAADLHQTISTIQNLSRRAGFGDLEETVLRKRIAETSVETDRKVYVSNLLDFYNERGAYQKAFDALESSSINDLAQTAQAARLIGNKEKELEALRANYWKPAEKPSGSDNEMTVRYLEILAAENPSELASLTEKNSAHQLQLINFLLGKGETRMAHAAIENSGFPKAWKVSRHAETSLALREFAESTECYFCDALQFDNIGGLIDQTPEKSRFLINDDWFRLTREYGEWLDERGDKTFASTKFLPAMTENLPSNSDEQFKLGEYYLAKNDYKTAIERVKTAIELDNFTVEDKPKLAVLIAAYNLANKPDYAEQCRTRFFEDGDADNLKEQIAWSLIYTQTLQKYGLAAKSHELPTTMFVEFLKTDNVENSEDFQNLIRAVTDSFTDESEKAKYFQTILNKRPTDKSLAEMLLNENLIDANHADFFHQRLIEGDKLQFDNYEYQEIFQRVNSDTNEAESVYEQEIGYQNDAAKEEYSTQWRKDDEEKVSTRRREYLQFLLKKGDDASAAQLIQKIEAEMRGKTLRPVWLRTAKFQIQIRHGKFDLAEAERFTSITASDAATQIKPPFTEKYNEIWHILIAANRQDESLQLSEAFFSRMLAVGKYDVSSFDGLARTYFQKGETEKAFDVLRLMIAASGENGRETALAETAALEAVKIRTPDAKKMADTDSDTLDRAETLKIAAETSNEFGQTAKAVEFRRELLSIDPNDSSNKLELAQLLIKSGANAEAAPFLREIIADRNAPRSERWQAREILPETGENAEIPNYNFDVFSQFYLGGDYEKSNQIPAAAEFYISSLIADQDAELAARQHLVKIYAVLDKPFAALKLAETDKSLKSDELLQTLSETAEKVFDYAKAIGFEQAKSKPNAERIETLQNLATQKNKRATDFAVNGENTRKL